MLNKKEIVDTIIKYGEEELKDFTPQEFRLLADRSKIFIDNIFDAYIYEEEEKVLSYIVDEQKKRSFIDLATGYRRRMKKWVKENPVNVSEQEIAIDDITAISPKLKKKLAYIIGGGTIAAVGIKFFSSWWASVIVELVALGFSYRIYKKERMNPAQIEMKIRFRKQELIDGLLADIDRWLDLATDESENVIKSYNLGILI